MTTLHFPAVFSRCGLPFRSSRNGDRFFYQRSPCLTAVGLTVMLAAVVFLSITLLFVGQITVNYISQNLSDFAHISWDQCTMYGILILRFVVIFIMFFIAISSIFYFAPAIHYNWRFFSIGSAFSTFACLAVSYGFSYYITNFGTYNKVYGLIGVLIALMI